MDAQKLNRPNTFCALVLSKAKINQQSNQGACSFQEYASPTSELCKLYLCKMSHLNIWLTHSNCSDWH